MLRSYKPLKRQSEKGKLKIQEFLSAERECLKRAKYICQARIPDVCMVKAVTAHHLKLRSQGGGNEQENLMAVCRDCHMFLHNNPAAATELGLMIQKR